MNGKIKGDTPPAPPKKPSLVLPRTEVERKLKERVALGREIQAAPIKSEDELDEARNRQRKWNDYNIDYLRRCFDSEVIAEKHENVPGWGAIYMSGTSLGRIIGGFQEGIGRQITELESLVERLELIPEATGAAPLPTQPKGHIAGRSVFVVHGHDEAAKSETARFIERLGLEAIILHEQPNKGQRLLKSLRRMRQM